MHMHGVDIDDLVAWHIPDEFGPHRRTDADELGLMSRGGEGEVYGAAVLLMRDISDLEARQMPGDFGPQLRAHAAERLGFVSGGGEGEGK